MRARGTVVAAAIFLLVGCGTTELEEVPTPDPAAVPSGSPQVIGVPATGPIVELGSGVISGLGWRYLAYPTDDGWCRQLETAEAIETDCSGLDPEDGDAFGSVTRNGRVIHGIATPDAATVWLVVSNTPTVPAFLMPLSDAELEGGIAFVGIVPSGTEVTHVMAVRSNGEVLGTRELP